MKMLRALYKLAFCNLGMALSAFDRVQPEFDEFAKKRDEWAKRLREMW